jgi:hypothetical protein
VTFQPFRKYTLTPGSTSVRRSNPGAMW